MKKAKAELDNHQAPLSVSTIELIVDILAKNSTYQPQRTESIYNKKIVAKPCQSEKSDIQVLYGENDHWVCTYYTGMMIFIYDSGHNWRSCLVDYKQKGVLEKLYPFLPSYGFTNYVYFKKPKLLCKYSASHGVFALYYMKLLLEGCSPEESVGSIDKKQIENGNALDKYLRAYLKDLVVKYDDSTVSDNNPISTHTGDIFSNVPTTESTKLIDTSKTTASTTASTKPIDTPKTTPSTTASTKPIHRSKTTPSTTASTNPIYRSKTTPSKTASTKPIHTPETTPSTTASTIPNAKPKTTPSTTTSTKPIDKPKTTPSTTASAEPTDTPKTTPSTTASAKPTDTPKTTPITTSSCSTYSSGHPNSVPLDDAKDSDPSIVSDRLFIHSFIQRIVLNLNNLLFIYRLFQIHLIRKNRLAEKPKLH